MGRATDPNGKKHSMQEVSAKYISSGSDWKVIAGLQARESFADRVYSHLQLELRDKLSRHFQWGVLYRAQINNRNNENWQLTPAGHRWTENNNGIESVWGGYGMARAMLTEQLRFEAKIQYEWSTLFSQQTLRYRSNLTHFWPTAQGPPTHVYIQHEIFIPLNYQHQQINQRWVYLGVNWPMPSGAFWGLSLAFAEWVWTESESFEKSFPGDQYKISDQAFILSLHVLFLGS